MGLRAVQFGFTSGELTPEMYGRGDDGKYSAGLALCRNFVVKPQGPVFLRPGTKYVNEAKYRDKKACLIPFRFSSTQTMVLEFGEHYIRFHTQGKTLLADDGTPYEVATDYAADDVFALHIQQSADVMTIVHPNYPPKELRRYGPTDWRLVDIDFAPKVGTPGAPTVTYTCNDKNATADQKDNYDLKYRVTALKDLGSNNETAESPASEIGQTKGNLYLTDSYATISWEAVAGADRYRVYKSYKGVYSYIGETDELTFQDENLEADASITPPRFDDAFKLSNGITSVTVENGGSGYYTWTGQVPDPSEKSYLTYQIGSVISSNPTRHTLPISFSVSDQEGDWAISVIDLYGAGTGGKVEVEKEVRTTSHTVNTGTLSHEKYETYYTTTTTFKSIRVTARGSGYVMPVVRMTVYGGRGFFGKRTWTITFYFDDRTGQELTLEVSDSTGTGAVISPVVKDGVITAANILQSGYNYTNPTIKILADKGSGAVLKANTGEGKEYPGAVAYFQQRRCFAGTYIHPLTVWMTRPGTEDDMSYTLPAQDDNRILFTVAAQEASRIRHLLPMTYLLAFTESTEFRMGGSNAVLTPSTINVLPQSNIGASDVQPLMVGSTAIYVAERGGHLRELGYNYSAQGYVSADLSIRANHLFENDEIVDLDLQKSPDSIVWGVTRNGKLLGFTYLPEQSVGAWHQHSTAHGEFESVCVVTEGDEDILYFVVRRYINGAYYRFIERMDERYFESLDKAFYVDCGAIYSGKETPEISGLTWLEGEVVSILANGCVLPQQVVTDGKIKLTQPSTYVVVGLPIQGDLQTLPVVLRLQDGSYGMGHATNINETWLRVYRSSGVFVGPDFEHLVEYKQRTTENYGSPPNLVTDEISIVQNPSWKSYGQVCLRQTDPLPLTVCSICFDLAT